MSLLKVHDRRFRRIDLSCRVCLELRSPLTLLCVKESGAETGTIRGAASGPAG